MKKFLFQIELNLLIDLNKYLLSLVKGKSKTINLHVEMSSSNSKYFAVYFFSILFLALSEPGKRISGFTVPSGIYFDNFVKAWTDGGFSNGIFNSFVVVFGVVSVTIFCSTLAAYAFEKLDIFGVTPLFALLLALIPFLFLGQHFNREHRKGLEWFLIQFPLVLSIVLWPVLFVWTIIDAWWVSSSIVASAQNESYLKSIRD